MYCILKKIMPNNKTRTFIKFILKTKICKTDDWRIGFQLQLGQGSFLTNNFEAKKL